MRGEGLPLVALPGESCRAPPTAPDRSCTDHPCAEPCVQVLGAGKPAATLVGPRLHRLELSVGDGLVDAFSRGTCVRGGLGGGEPRGRRLPIGSVVLWGHTYGLRA